MYTQKSFTAVTEIKENHIEKTLALIRGKEFYNNFKENFSSNNSIHFLRWFVINESKAVQGLSKKYLVFSFNYDGLIELVMTDFISVHRHLLDKLYRNCVNYPDKKSEDDIFNYFNSQVSKEPLFWVAKRGWSKRRILEEAALRREVEEKLDQLPKDNFIKNVPVAMNGFKDRIQKLNDTMPCKPYFLKGMAMAIINFFFRLFLFLPSGFLGTIVRLLQRKKTNQISYQPGVTHYEQIRTNEDCILQNQLTVHGILKSPMWIWKTKFRISLALAGMVASFKRDSRLGKIEGVHFAKWLMIPNDMVDQTTGKKKKIYHCLFLSDYDGSWENYLSDFIDRGSVGINFTFSNLNDYPPINFIFKGGASKISFKKVVRQYQIECPFWYSGYPEILVKDILRNSAIVKGLEQIPNDEKTIKNWLKLFS